MNYKQACLKRTAEHLLIYPLVLLGKLLGLLMPYKHRSPYFLFFPSDGIGGATKVNADILELLQPFRPSIVFSKKYNNNSFADRFLLPGVSIIDLRDKIDNKALHFINIIYRGILSTWINRSGTQVVFGGESLYFYKVIPYLNRDIKIVELTHMNTWLNYNQAFIRYMDVRITSTPKIKRDIAAQYEQNKVPEHYGERLMFIDNWVTIPEAQATPKETGHLNVLFVGRGSPQKRVHLIAQAAARILKQTREISFTFVGDVKSLLPAYVQEHTEVFENISDPRELSALYDKADILILTSAFEGLPIVVMDMMVRGKVVISTAVDGIPDYIRDRETGLLIKELYDEQQIVDTAVALILEMKADPQQLHRMGHNAMVFSRSRFSKALFEEKYRAVLDCPAAAAQASIQVQGV